MNYNFDAVVDRSNTNSVKWDFVESFLGSEDVLPMWVADMDFATPKPVIDALKKRVEHGIFGYAERTDSYFEAIINWMKKRHNWSIKKEWFAISPGVVPAIYWLIRAFTHPGDKVIIQRPVYYPFFGAVERNGCHIVNNALKLVNDEYTMDFEDLEKKVQDPRVKVFVLCNPHNPVGRVWKREELLKLGEICVKNDVIVISDEIHSDLILKGHKHIPFSTISEEFAQNSIICTAPSKTFNLAGLQTSNIIIPNERLRNEYNKVLENNSINNLNVVGIVACEAAYRYGEEWLEQLLDYLEGNLEFLMNFIKENIPQIKVIKPQGTYLIWMDCRELGMDTHQLEDLMLKKAKVGFDEGYIFGVEGEGFERINIACPRYILETGLKRIEKAINSLK